MRRIRWTWVLVMLWHVAAGYGGQHDAWTRTPDVIYGRKHGVALTLDVFTPAPGDAAGERDNPAVIYVVSAGWFSSPRMIDTDALRPFLDRGYTVFAVVHGSQPKYTIPEIIEDLHRSVRFIRHHADRYSVDPDRLGIVGCSAGGHLSLMIGTDGRKGRPDAEDPVDRESSRVRAVGCYFPPTDFLNYGREGYDVFKALEKELAAFRAPFDFQVYDGESRRYHPVTDMKERLRIAREISPITHVSADDPPTLIIHGDADTLVPIQQSKVMIEALDKAGVPTKLIIKPGANHGWANWTADMLLVADWFDAHLKKKVSGRFFR